MAYAHLAATAVRVSTQPGRETKTACPPPSARASIFFVALLTDHGEASNSRFCDFTEMIQNDDTMGHFRGAGRLSSNLARPPDAACPTRNPDTAEETLPAILRFPPDALCCDYRLMENDMGYFCEVGRQPSFLAHTPYAAWLTWRSEFGWNITELLCGRAPISLRLCTESQICSLFSNDCS